MKGCKSLLLLSALLVGSLTINQPARASDFKIEQANIHRASAVKYKVPKYRDKMNIYGSVNSLNLDAFYADSKVEFKVSAEGSGEVLKHTFSFKACRKGTTCIATGKLASGNLYKLSLNEEGEDIAFRFEAKKLNLKAMNQGVADLTVSICDLGNATCSIARMQAPMIKQTTAIQVYEYYSNLN
jgi:hypothetical protein